MMKLDDWRTRNGHSYATLGKLLGTSAEAARRYCAGERTPRPGQMAAISEATAGQVTANDFVPAPPKVEDLL